MEHTIFGLIKKRGEIAGQHKVNLSVTVKVQNVGKTIAEKVWCNARLIEADMDIAGVGNRELLDGFKANESNVTFTQAIFPNDEIEIPMELNCSPWKENSFYEHFAEYKDGIVRSHGTRSAYQLVMWVYYAGETSSGQSRGSGGIFDFPAMRVLQDGSQIIELSTQGKVQGQ